MICYPLSIKFVTTPFKSWLNRFQLQLKFMTSISQHYPIFLKKWTLLKKLPCVFCWNYQSIMTLDRFNWITTRFKSWLFSPIWNSNWWLNLRQTLKKRTFLKIFRSLFCLQLRSIIAWNRFNFIMTIKAGTRSAAASIPILTEITKQFRHSEKRTLLKIFRFIFGSQSPIDYKIESIPFGQ